jgi:hypothetical protein
MTAFQLSNNSFPAFPTSLIAGFQPCILIIINTGWETYSYGLPKRVQVSKIGACTGGHQKLSLFCAGMGRVWSVTRHAAGSAAGSGLGRI